MVSAPPVRWWEVGVLVPRELADDAAALAVDAGAGGAEITDVDAERARLILSFAGDHPEREVRTLAAAALAQVGIEATLEVREREDTDWSERWKENFDPLRLGERVWIVPSWHERFSPPDGGIVIELDPGMAFGTGQHATTALCTEWLGSNLSAGQTALDVGCGSGILSMVAARLGAKRVVGVDNDPTAVEVARENAEINGIEIDLSERPLAEVEGTFDVVVANILSHTLCELAPELVCHTGPDGWLVLSGIFDGDGQEQEIVAAFRAACAAAGRPAFAPQRAVRDKWLLLAARV